MGDFRQRTAVLALISLLSVPSVLSFLKAESSAKENRNFATLPAFPRDGAEWLLYPQALDGWINDHFGLREPLLELNEAFRYQILGELNSTQATVGKHHRVFLGSHVPGLKNASSELLQVCGYGDTPDDFSVKVKRNRLALETFKKQGIDVHLLVVPSAPILYPEDLPGWLGGLCETSPPQAQRILDALKEEEWISHRILYPRQELMDMKAEFDVIPKSFFHWKGKAPRRIARLVAEKWFKRSKPSSRWQVRNEELASDIGFLFPGVSLKEQVETIDFPASGVSVCSGATCFPEFPQGVPSHGSYERYLNPNATPGRLLILGDSFGYALAGWFAQYFGEVLTIETNQLSRLSPAGLTQLRAFVKAPENQGNILFIHYDGGIQRDRFSLVVKTLFQ